MSSSDVRRQRGGVTRVLAKLQTAVEAGNYYEAHQMYRTLYFRYNAQKKYDDCAKMLFDGSVLLFSNDQVTSGVDLAKLYLEILEQSKKEPAEDIFQNISKLYSFIPVDNPDREGFLGTAIRWSAKEGHNFGHPRLHQLLAYAMWTSKRYPESRHHFLYSCDGSGCGSMMVEFHVSRGFKREVDLFVVGTVLQFLCLRKTIVAAFTLQAYTKQHPSISSGPPYCHPLLNFVWLLLLSIEHGKSLSAFSVLVEKYKPSLIRDPTNLEYLDKIGQHFFGVPPPQRPQRPSFSGIFDSLFNALNEDSDDDEPSRPKQSTATKMETEDLD